MPLEGQQLFKSRDDILQDLLNGLLARVSDAYTGEDGNIVLFFQVIADTEEAVFMAVQITADDMFVATASPQGLQRHGEQFGINKMAGLKSSGSLLFTGEGGTSIPTDTEAAYDPGNGDDPLYFKTTEDVTIPNPGTATAPAIADGGGSGAMGAGTYEYAISFSTAAGETLIGAVSNALVQSASHKVNLTAIPLGGPGTTARNIYRRVNGGAWGLSHTISDNTTTVYTDNNAATTTAPLSASTAERVEADAESEDFGAKYNLLPNTITVLTNAPDGVTDVVNQASFTGGSDEELTEDFRSRLLNAIRNPGTGSPGDIQTWAEAVPGVGSATVFSNDNLGTPTNGHVTVRVTAPDGSVPDSDVLTAVQDALEAQDLANATFHVAGFTSTTQNVTVDVTAQSGYDLTDITPAVQAAVTNYINALDAGATFRLAGVIEAVMNVIGVLDVSVTSPGSNQTTTADHKFVAGTVTVT